MPSEIESYFTHDEKIITTEKSKQWEIYVTNKRVLLKKGGVFGKEIVEASYRHISSIEYRKKSPWEYIISGIFLIIAPFAANYLGPAFFEDFPDLGLVIYVGFILGGIISIIMSFFIKPDFKIHVVGRKPLTLSGELEEIIKIIREYREKVEAETVKNKSK